VFTECGFSASRADASRQSSTLVAQLYEEGLVTETQVGSWYIKTASWTRT